MRYVGIFLIGLLGGGWSLTLWNDHFDAWLRKQTSVQLTSDAGIACYRLPPDHGVPKSGSD